MIHFTHVYKTYQGPIHALRDVNLHIDKGEFVFLTGPSGAGKTTLFKMLCAFDKISSGGIQVAGMDLNTLKSSQLPFFRRKIGVVFQDFKLLPTQSIFDNVALPLLIRNDRALSIQRRVNEMLDQVGLISKAKMLPSQLSGGEQQRVAIARALVHQPGVLIADEPTGNLDPQLSEEIMDLLEKVCAQGTTVFIATHAHDLVAKRNKRVLHLSNGCLGNPL